MGTLNNRPALVTPCSATIRLTYSTGKNFVMHSGSNQITRKKIFIYKHETANKNAFISAADDIVYLVPKGTSQNLADCGNVKVNRST